MSTVRTVNTAQTTYQTTYRARGYAPDLATLGSADTSCSAGANADRACLLDAMLGAAQCTSGTWCQKNGYRFTIISNCNVSSSSAQEDGSCKEYVAAATPINSGTGLHNYCSVSDAIVRARRGAPLVRPPTAEECGEWAPI